MPTVTDARIDAHDARLDAHDRRLDGQHAKLEIVEDRVHSFAIAMSAAGQRLSSCELDLKEHVDRDCKVHERIPEEKTVTDHEKRIRFLERAYFVGLGVFLVAGPFLQRLVDSVWPRK